MPGLDVEVLSSQIRGHFRVPRHHLAAPLGEGARLMAWLVQHPPPGVWIVSFFVTARYAGQADSTAFTDGLLEQLVAITGEQLPPATSAAARDWLRRHLLTEAVARAGPVGRSDRPPPVPASTGAADRPGVVAPPPHGATPTAPRPSRTRSARPAAASRTPAQCSGTAPAPNTLAILPRCSEQQLTPCATSIGTVQVLACIGLGPADGQERWPFDDAFSSMVILLVPYGVIALWTAWLRRGPCDGRWWTTTGQVPLNDRLTRRRTMRRG
jgi:hypothetical protein